MSGRKGRTGGHNAIPCRWNGLDFSSFDAFDQYHGLCKGYGRSYWKANRDYLGFPLVSEGQNESRKRTRTDADMIAFYSFANARRSLIPDIGLKGMLQLFTESKS